MKPRHKRLAIIAGIVAAVAVAAALANPAKAVTSTRAEVAVMADLAAVVLAPERCGLPSLAVTEEMADLAAAQASALAPTLICTALPETEALSEEVATAVAVAEEVELSEAPSSMRAVRFLSATAPSPITM